MRFKFLMAILLIVFSISFYCGCKENKTIATFELQQFQNGRMDVMLKYPESWGIEEEYEPAYHSRITFSENDEAKIEIEVDYVPESTTIDSYYETIMGPYNLGRVKGLQRSETSLAGHPALRLSFVATHPKYGEIRCNITYTVLQGRVFAVSCIVHADANLLYEKLFSQVTDSFSIISETGLHKSIKPGEGIIATFIPSDSYTDEELITSSSIIRGRLMAYGITEYSVEAAPNSVLVQVWNEEDLNTAIKLVAPIGTFQFREVIEEIGVDSPAYAGTKTTDVNQLDRAVLDSLLEQDVVLQEDGNGNGKLLLGPDLLTAHVIVAEPGEAEDNSWYVGFLLKDDEVMEFKRITESLVGKRLAILLDYMVLATPEVFVPVVDGRAGIKGGFNRDDAIINACIIRFNELPIDFSDNPEVVRYSATQ